MHTYEENVEGQKVWINDKTESHRKQECLCEHCYWNEEFCDTMESLRKLWEKKGIKTITTMCPYWKREQIEP